MRIGGYGSGLPGQSGGGRDRAAAFRSRHSVGQRVKGRILRREANGLTWVLVGGEELLARLEVQAEPGDELLFLVRALTPEIMLQALPQGGYAADDLPGLIQRFRASREGFEQQDRGLFEPLSVLPPDPIIRREAFSLALSANSDAEQRHAKIQELLAQVNAALAAGLGLSALYLPWLTPSLRRQEILLRQTGGGHDAALSATEAASGAVELRAVSRPGQCSLRLLSQHPDKSGPLQVELAALARQALGLEPELQAVPMRAMTPRGGVLGELFGDVPVWSSGGINTRV